ncbi:hypothetical protein IWQ60_002238 [Tieghemiomyces parasiticus]|uniref:Uncharacterized protein n=1 Tax=Tieghemiomyces parasiticus TaxID=78921 RepID=A0A9W8AIC4_9FUNG|nr:hypothetical protein IWQ60_002238 [Tieghemiomyces parasiticus]
MESPTANWDVAAVESLYRTVAPAMRAAIGLRLERALDFVEDLSIDDPETASLNQDIRESAPVLRAISSHYQVVDVTILTPAERTQQFAYYQAIVFDEPSLLRTALVVFQNLLSTEHLAAVIKNDPAYPVERWRREPDLQFMYTDFFKEFVEDWFIPWSVFTLGMAQKFDELARFLSLVETLFPRVKEVTRSLACLMAFEFSTDVNDVTRIPLTRIVNVEELESFSHEFHYQRAAARLRDILLAINPMFETTGHWTSLYDERFFELTLEGSLIVRFYQEKTVE